MLRLIVNKVDKNALSVFSVFSVLVVSKITFNVFQELC